MALVAIAGLYVSTLYLVLHRHAIAAVVLGLAATGALVLAMTWYRTLPAPEPVPGPTP